MAAEVGVSRACLSKWKRRFDELGLLDRSSAPHLSPTQTADHVVELIEAWRREKKWTVRQIWRGLTMHGHTISVATIGRWFVRLGINRRRDLGPDGSSNRVLGKITARFPGHMIHLDVKKVGRIPDGGGWGVHWRGSAQDLAATNAKDRSARQANRTGTKSPRGGYVYLHCAIDGYSRLAYTEHLADEKAATTSGFWARAQASFTAHAITRIVRVITDNGANKVAAFYRTITAAASRHQRTRPYTPRHNGKVERYNRTLAEEFHHSRLSTSEQQRADVITTWNIHYN